MSKEHYGGRRALRPKLQAARRAEEGKRKREPAWSGRAGEEEGKRKRGPARGERAGEEEGKRRGSLQGVEKQERKRGPAWGKIAGSNFRLGSYKDANGQLMADRLPFLWSWIFLADTNNFKLSITRFDTYHQRG